MKPIAILFLAIAVLMTACTKEPSRIDDGFLGGIALSTSQTTLAASQRTLISGTSVTITLSVKDQNGTAFYVPKSSPVVVFSATGGTSRGTFGAIENFKNGTYTTTFTGTTAGTATNISASVDGIVVDATATAEVGSGNLSLANSYLTLSATSGASGSLITATLHTMDLLNNPLTSGGLTVVISNTGGTSTGTFSSVTDNHDGTYSATFFGVLAGTATALNATIGGALITSTLPTATVTHGPASQIVYTTQPTGGVAQGMNLPTQPVLSIRDANSNVVTTGVDATADVTLSLTSGTGALSGTLTLAAINGIATFSGISVDTQGAGKVITANKAGTFFSGGTTSKTVASNSFAINPPAPGAFAISSAVAGLSSVFLTWGASTNVTTYEVRYGTSTGVYGTTFSSSATSPTTVTGLTPGITYYFRVIATNVTGSVLSTNEISSAVYQTFTLNIPFTAGTESSYILSDPTRVDLASGVVRLTPASQSDNSTNTGVASGGFMNGTLAGVQWDNPNSYVRLNTTTNNAELDASWTPQWSNLVGYWKLNGSGAVANASAITATIGSNGVAANANGLGLAHASGHSNQGLIFDGVDDSVSVPHHASLNLTGDWTLSGWVNRQASGQGSIVEKYHWAGGFGGYVLRINAAGRVEASLIQGTSAESCAGTSVLANNRWYYVAATYSSATKALKCYLDGAVESTVIGTLTSVSTSVPLQIGQRGDGTGARLPETLDEIAVWNNDLSAVEIATIYSRQSAKYSGQILSRVMDAWSSQLWSTLVPSTTLPFFKELPGSAGSESSSIYTSMGADLMNGLVGLWHMNESSATAGASNDFMDLSGLGNHGEQAGGVTFGSPGAMGPAATFDGVDDSVTFGSTNIPTSSSARTTSAWFKQNSLANRGILVYGSQAGSQLWEMMAFNGHLMLHAYGGGQDTASIAAPINIGQWHHGTITYNGTTVRVYLDGKYRGQVNLALNTGNSIFKLGGPGYFSNWNGQIDEAAIWNRALSDNEVLDLYRRGANRVKYQLRSCSASDCSDQDALTTTGMGWKGPDNTQLSYFSELYNTTSNVLSGTVSVGAPTMTFSNFSGSGLSVTANRYFQYCAVLESDDQNTLCNYGAGAVACSPELKSVAIGPNHYDSAPQSIVSKASIGSAYQTLDTNGMTEALGGNACSGGAKYSLSSDGTNFYYWDGSTWTTSVAYATANDAATMRTNISSFPSSAAGTGTLQIKTYLKSNGTSACEVDNLQFTGKKY